ncbi:MAG: hypothetical protein IJF94_01785 [Eubacterium sp.]|nr:hypothetical protein [Eubacterium sp.]
MATAKKATKKTAAKKTTKKAAPKKAAAKKTAAKKPATKKKAAAKKTTTKKTHKIILEIGAAKYNADVIEKKVMTAYTKASKKKTAKSVEIYIKPEDGKAYFVIDKVKGDVNL